MASPTAASATSPTSPAEATPAGSSGQVSSPAAQQRPSPAPGSASVTAGGSSGTGSSDTGGSSGTGGQPAASRPAVVTPEPTLPLRATQQAAAQAATASEGQRYIDLARKAAPGTDRPGTNWDVQVIPDEDGPAVMLMMPLGQPPSGASALAAAKQRIADVVNAVFVNEPKVVRVGVVGTYQNSSGREAPAISLIVRKSASPRWGAVTPAELERLAQTLHISSDFQK